jgi:hypothetical protein
MEFNQRSEAKTQAGRVTLRKCLAQELVQKKLRLEIRSGGGEFDFADAISQIQPFALLAGRPEKAR